MKFTLDMEFQKCSKQLWCARHSLQTDHYEHHGLQTVTSLEQMKVESSISSYFEYYLKRKHNENELKLDRAQHVAYLKKGLQNLSCNFENLDASRPWLVYWCVHGLYLLGQELDITLQSSVIDFLARCQSEDGGFGGGPGQLPHLAPTYAAVNALVTIGTAKAYETINRQGLADFLSRMVTPEGAFLMHEGGEVDIRGTYCAVAVARLTKQAVHPLFSHTPRWIVQCQTYEGGFSGGPGLEAHGGYTFCGLAALALLRSEHLADTKRLLRWVASRQLRYSGGFQGRTNKLVDGCYSFWQGALFPLLHHTLSKEARHLDLCQSSSEQGWLFHVEALQNYLLVCCQSPKGGLIDKPGKSADFYHTCYTLSGLSIAQHYCYDNERRNTVVGHPSNEVALTHPLYNVVMSSVLRATQHFSLLPSLQPSVCCSSTEAGPQQGEDEAEDGNTTSEQRSYCMERLHIQKEVNSGSASADVNTCNNEIRDPSSIRNGLPEDTLEGVD